MELTLGEVKPIIKYIIENNRKLEERGVSPIAIGLCGVAGIGKSQILKQIADEINANYVFLSVSQIVDPGDLCGFPQREYYACKDDGTECAWITAELLNAYSKQGWTITDDTRMGYAVPAWLKGLDPSKPLVFNCDDVSRAAPTILNALMEIILQQRYVSWELPKGSTVVLSSNPDNGEYLVNSTDSAFQSRYINFDVRFEIKDWARWAENAQMDSRAINFFLNSGYELTESKNGNAPVANARSYTMFANTISGIPNWENPDSLGMIMQIASGCFLDKDNIVGSLFTSFVHNKLDKLITPEDMLLEEWEICSKRISECVYRGEEYQPQIASILQIRLLNYIRYYFEHKGETKVVQDRLLAFCEASESADSRLFSEDLIFDIIKILLAEYPARCNKFLQNSKFRTRILA